MKVEELKIKPINFTLSTKVNFPISNEDLSPLAKDLEKISGLNYYIGICGGGTQNIYLLYLLSNKNKFKSIRLLDVNKEQLLNFIDIVNVLKSSKNDLQYLSNLVKRQHTIIGGVSSTYTRFLKYFYPMFKNKFYGFEETNLKRYLLRNFKEIELLQSDLTKYLVSERLQRGKYFVYVSNIFTYTGMSWRRYKNLLLNIVKELVSFKTGWKDRADKRYVTEELELLISKNRYIFEGSMILVYMGGFLLTNKYIRILLFEKKRGKIELVKSYTHTSNLMR
ncbi:MAG: hypothetical protein QXL94_06825 [Candidatus Parvarchaeum sp.]